MNKYVIGIDGGGSHTEGVLAILNGEILKRIKKGPSSALGTPFPEAKKNLIELINELLEARLDNGPVECLFAGISGCGVKEHGILYTNTLREAFFNKTTIKNIIIDTDVLTPAYAIGKSSDVIVAICGTGCVAYALSEGKRYRIDGYGYLFGDDAGGFNIGSQVLRQILRDEDGRGPKTKMTELFKEKTGKTAIDSVFEINEGGKGKVASFAPIAFEAATLGDTAAIKILDKAVSDICDMLTAAAKHIDKTPVPIVIAGGIFKANNSYILQKVKQRLPNYFEWFDNVTDVVIGAVNRATELAIKENQE